MNEVSDDDQVLLGAVRAMVALSVRATASLPVEVSSAQLRALTILHRAGTTNLADLTQQLGVVASAASRLCDRLVAAGLVLRAPSAHTRREIDLRLTPTGERLISEVNERRIQAMHAILASIPAPRRVTVLRALATFAAAADAEAELCS
jgi:DNA-binding MarR family transcriptional regulator